MNKFIYLWRQIFESRCIYWDERPYHSTKYQACGNDIREYCGAYRSLEELNER